MSMSLSTYMCMCLHMHMYICTALQDRHGETENYLSSTISPVLFQSHHTVRDVV